MRAVALAVMGWAVLLGGCRPQTPVVTPSTFRGFESIVLRNGAVEAVVVPAIGRVMGFGLAGAAMGPFWSHPALGKGLAADDNGWINYGGDKAWPAPQSDWPDVVGRGWPPPKAFDAKPFLASMDPGGSVKLVSATDPDYGIRVWRWIALEPSRPAMTIETTYEKINGPPVNVAVWTITQLVSPERVFVLLPERSALPNGHARKLPAAPKDLRLDGRLLSLARDTREKTMIGSDGRALLWVGAGASLLIEDVTDYERTTAMWDGGFRSQIYTSPTDDEAYVELELLGRAQTLSIGETATMKVRYTLVPRTGGDPILEAQKIWSKPREIHEISRHE